MPGDDCTTSWASIAQGYNIFNRGRQILVDSALAECLLLLTRYLKASKQELSPHFDSSCARPQLRSCPKPVVCNEPKRHLDCSGQAAVVAEEMQQSQSSPINSDLTAVRRRIGPLQTQCPLALPLQQRQTPPPPPPPVGSCPETLKLLMTVMPGEALLRCHCQLCAHCEM